MEEESIQSCPMGCFHTEWICQEEGMVNLGIRPSGRRFVKCLNGLDFQHRRTSVCITTQDSTVYVHYNPLTQLRIATVLPSTANLQTSWRPGLICVASVTQYFGSSEACVFATMLSVHSKH